VTGPSTPLDVDAVAFDLLTALVDSWTLWEDVAGEAALGRHWRQASLRLVTALDALGLAPAQVLFVAGSAHDVPGAGNVGMPVYWSNRQSLPLPDGPPPLVDAPDLTGLPALLGL
jgi:hypothetical protein